MLRFTRTYNINSTNNIIKRVNKIDQPKNIAKLLHLSAKSIPNRYFSSCSRQLSSRNQSFLLRKLGMWRQVKRFPRDNSCNRGRISGSRTSLCPSQITWNIVLTSSLLSTRCNNLTIYIYIYTHHTYYSYYTIANQLFYPLHDELSRNCLRVSRPFSRHCPCWTLIYSPFLLRAFRQRKGFGKKKKK